MIKMERASLILMFSLVMTIGLMSIPQDAYASFDEIDPEPENVIHCNLSGFLDEETLTFIGEGGCVSTLFAEFDQIDIEGIGTITDLVFEDEEECGSATVNWTLTFTNSELDLILDGSTLRILELSEVCFFGFNEDGLLVFFGITNVTGGTGTFSNACRGEGISIELIFLDEDLPFFSFLSQEIEFCNKSSGGSCTNCQQPSIGVTERGTRVVDGGLTVNGQTVHADYYHTPFPLIQANIGESITMQFKIWDDRRDNISHVEVGLGKGKIGESFGTIEKSMIWNRHVMTKIETVTHDPMFTNVQMTMIGKQPCKIGGTDCDVFKIKFTPTVAIVGDVVFGVSIWDDNNNAVTTFFNDGMQIGTQEDVIVIDDSISVVIKKQLRTDDGLGNVDDRNSPAFAKKLAWHNEQINNLVTNLGY